MTNSLLGAILGILIYGMWKISAQLDAIRGLTSNINYISGNILEELHGIRRDTKETTELLYLISNASNSKEISDEKDVNALDALEKTLAQTLRPGDGVDPSL